MRAETDGDGRTEWGRHHCRPMPGVECHEGSGENVPGRSGLRLRIMGVRSTTRFVHEARPLPAEVADMVLLFSP